METAPEQITPVTSPRDARPRGLRAYLAVTYGRELPRIVREMRWLMGGLAVVMGAGVWWGYRGAGQSTFSEYFERNPFATVSALGHLLGPGVWGHGWLGIFIPNSLKAVFSWCAGCITLGAYALWYAWYNGWAVGWVMYGCVPVARELSGVGPLGVTAAVLLPHGIFEYPALLLAWALGVRTGLAWVWRVPGRGRWESVVRMLRDSRRALLLVLPLLLVAGLVEAYVTPRLRDRYVYGVGLFPGLAAETIEASNVVGRVSLSPDGTKLLRLVDGKVMLYRGRGAKAEVLFAPKQRGVVEFPWSRDSARVVVTVGVDISRPDTARPTLVVIDTATGRQTVVHGLPGSQCGPPAWSSDGRHLALVARAKSTSAKQKMPSDVWVVDLRTQRWRRLTHLPFATCARSLSAPTWNPQGTEIAFTRRGSSTYSSSIWAARTDGRGLRQVTHGDFDDAPAWSPDGRWIAFLSRSRLDADEDALDKPMDVTTYTPEEVGLIHPDGTGRVDGVAKADSLLAWSADGKSVYYTRLDLLLKGTPRLLTAPSPAR